MPNEPIPPVPLRRRADGWTPERQYAFLAALGETRSITRAALAVGLSRASLYRLRGRSDAGAFAAAIDAAFAPPQRGQTKNISMDLELSEPLSPSG